jgi:hypothetical protein
MWRSVRRAVLLPLVLSSSALTTTPTATVTPTRPAVAVACVGDCNGDGLVTVDSILVMVGIAIGLASADACVAGDANGDTAITIDEVLLAVNAALNGCGTPTATPTATPVLLTPTPGSVAGSVAIGSAVMANAMAEARSVVAAFVTGIQLGGAAGLVTGGSGAGTGQCPGGGTATSESRPPASLAIILSQCELPTASGTVRFNGTASTQGQAFNVDMEATYADAMGTPTLVATTIINGSIASMPGGRCFFTAINLEVTSGRLAARVPDGNEVAVTFRNATVSFDDVTYDASCVPVTYQLAFDGPAMLQTPSAPPTSVVFDNLRLHVDERADPAQFTLDGGVEAACFGGAVTIATEAALQVATGQICPIAGSLAVTAQNRQAFVHYRADRSVEIDANGNGIIEDGEPTVPSCLDLSLLMCVA